MTKPDYKKIGSRIREARIEKGLTQAELGAKTGCSNNHMSHIETEQTKVSLTMLLEISSQLEKDLNYFLMDTPFISKETMINSSISSKLDRCDHDTLLVLNGILDVLLESQERRK